jgi:uncharacterized protein (TIGR03083 family)
MTATDEYCALIASETAALAAFGRRVDLGARVASCPDWDVAELLRHVGTAHRWSRHVVETREPVPPKTVDRALPDDATGLPDWLEAGAAELVATIAPADPDGDCWSWAGDHHVRFWPRRMAFETLVHRWDAQTAAGEQEPFAAELAVDGLDEHLANLPYFRDAPRGDGQTLHVHCTDADGEWLLTQTPRGLLVTPEHAKADVALRGGASDLFLVVLGRQSTDTVEVFGAEALDAWRPVLAF